MFRSDPDNVNLTMILIMFLLGLCAAQAQQTSPKALQQSAYNLYQAAWDGDKTALQQLRLLAEQGQADAQSLLGRVYFFSFRVPKDCVEAVSWSLKGAEQGYSLAQFSLGMLYGGICGPRDPVEQLRWYRKAAEQGKTQKYQHRWNHLFLRPDQFSRLHRCNDEEDERDSA